MEEERERTNVSLCSDSLLPNRIDVQICNKVNYLIKAVRVCFQTKVNFANINFLSCNSCIQVMKRKQEQLSSWTLPTLFILITLTFINFYHLVGKVSHGTLSCFGQGRQKVIFLKTHKCASSVIQNILHRRVVKEDLNVVLPLSGNYLGFNRPFHRSDIADTPWEKANMAYDIFR